MSSVSEMPTKTLEKPSPRVSAPAQRLSYLPSAYPAGAISRNRRRGQACLAAGSWRHCMENAPRSAALSGTIVAAGRRTATSRASKVANDIVRCPRRRRTPASGRSGVGERPHQNHATSRNADICDGSCDQWRSGRGPPLANDMPVEGFAGAIGIKAGSSAFRPGPALFGARRGRASTPRAAAPVERVAVRVRGDGREAGEHRVVGHDDPGADLAQQFAERRLVLVARAEHHRIDEVDDAG